MRRGVVLTLFLAVSGFAQQTPPPPQQPSTNPYALPRASESVEVSIVSLDCIVTDKSGRHVRNLTRDDFEILENGKLQPITNFSEYASDVTEDASGSHSHDAAEQSSANTSLTGPAKRTIVIFADDFFSASFSMVPIVRSLKALLSAEIRPGDAVSVVAWRNGMQIRQDLTDDLAAVGSALDRITEESYKRGPYGDTLERGAEAVAMHDFLNGAAGLRGSAVNASTRWVDLDRGGTVTMDAMYARVAEIRRQRKVFALEQIIGTIGNTEGRKALFILSTDSTGLGAVAEMANAYGVTIYGIYPSKPPVTFSAIDASYSPYWILNPFGINDVIGGPYGLLEWDPIGGFFRGSSFVSENALLIAQIAGLESAYRQTGGLMAIGAPDVRRLMPKVAEDLDSYYSLAYKMTPSTGGKRRVEVWVKNPEYRVRAREAIEDLSLGRRVVDQVRGNLIREPLPSRIPTAVVVGNPIRKNKHAFILPVDVQFAGKDLTLLQAGDGRRGSFSVYVQVGRRIGPPPEGGQVTFDFSSTDVERAPDGVFRYSFQLMADDYTDRISVGILDELSGETGFAVADLEATAERKSSKR